MYNYYIKMQGGFFINSIFIFIIYLFLFFTLSSCISNEFVDLSYITIDKTQLINNFIYALVLWNLITFCVFWVDKLKAKKNKWRISEKTLILLSFFMGGIGGLIGMYFLRHKTKHLKFKVLIPISIVFNIFIIILFYNLLGV